MTVAAAVLAGCAVWVAYDRGPSSRLAVLGQPSRPAIPDLSTALSRVVHMLGGVWRRRAELRSRRAAVAELCLGLSVELRAGRTPADALQYAVTVLQPPLSEELRGVVPVAHDGGDVCAALQEAGRRPGAEALVRLAVCWRVGASAGAGLASAIERLADTLRAEEQHRDEVNAHLAGPRATARLLAGLPALGLAMASFLGARPAAFLLEGPYGLTCLVLGVGLDVLGLLWTRRLARAAENSA
ncbi:MAG: type II secretion system F family protein [Streptosporangiaceae bacterium]